MIVHLYTEYNVHVYLTYVKVIKKGNPDKQYTQSHEHVRKPMYMLHITCTLINCTVITYVNIACTDTEECVVLGDVTEAIHTVIY